MNLDELLGHPDDARRFQVFADQLIERGDPRGVLATLAKQVILDGQEDTEDDYRYVAISE